MFNKWLKPYLPRSLFGRAFLILIVPIILFQRNQQLSREREG